MNLVRPQQPRHRKMSIQHKLKNIALCVLHTEISVILRISHSAFSPTTWILTDGNVMYSCEGSTAVEHAQFDH